MKPNAVICQEKVIAWHKKSLTLIIFTWAAHIFSFLRISKMIELLTVTYMWKLMIIDGNSLAVFTVKFSHDFSCDDCLQTSCHKLRIQHLSSVCERLDVDKLLLLIWNFFCRLDMKMVWCLSGFSCEVAGLLFILLCNCTRCIRNQSCFHELPVCDLEEFVS